MALTLDGLSAAPVSSASSEQCLPRLVIGLTPSRAGAGMLGRVRTGTGDAVGVGRAVLVIRAVCVVRVVRRICVARVV